MLNPTLALTGPFLCHLFSVMVAQEAPAVRESKFRQGQGQPSAWAPCGGSPGFCTS